MLTGLSIITSSAQEREVAVVAHRGYWNCEEAGYAKNSVAAFKQALEMGYWGSEFDVNMSADGKLLVYHDGSVSGKSIEKHPASEFASERLSNGEIIPLIDEFLKIAVENPGTMLVYELKPHSCEKVEAEAVAKSIEKLKEYDLFHPEKVMFISFSAFVCEQFALSAPGFTVQYLGANANPDKLVKKNINGIDTRFTVLLSNKKLYESARKNGMSVNTWTVNKESDIRMVIELGVDQITSDYPERVRQILKEMGVKEKVAE